MKSILSLRWLIATVLLLLPTVSGVQAMETAAPADPVYDVTPSIVSFHQTGVRDYSLVFAFDVREKLPPGSSTFVHFTHDGQTLLYMGTGIESSPESWPVGQVVEGPVQYGHFPPVLADGSYPILVGIFIPADGRRLHLKGIDDGSQRYQAGILVVADHGRTLSLTGPPAIGKH